MKKWIVTLIAFLMMFAMPFTINAAEIERTGTGDIASRCNLTFSIMDESGNYPGTSFTAIMTDVTGTIMDSYTFTKGNSWGKNKNPKYTVMSPTTYNVTFEGLKEGYSVIDRIERSDKISFASPAQGDVYLYWSIVLTEDIKEDQVATEEMTGGQMEAQDEKEVFQTFLETVSYIENEENWKIGFLFGYDVLEKSHAKWYKNYVEGGTEEEYSSMTLFERFLWCETYLRFAWASNTGDYDTYFGNEENFKKNITSNVVNLMDNVPGNEAVVDAYLELAKWQYNHIKENGRPFNFMNHRDSFENSEKIPETTTDAAETETVKPEIVETEENRTEETEEKEEGIWDSTFDLLAENVLTIVIIIILAIAIAFVVWKREKLNLEDNDNE